MKKQFPDNKEGAINQFEAFIVSSFFHIFPFAQSFFLALLLFGI